VVSAQPRRVEEEQDQQQGAQPLSPTMPSQQQTSQPPPKQHSQPRPRANQTEAF
jgi:hypothetical protein